jgi:homoprotocatechuate degradation regulator HpaR
MMLNITLDNVMPVYRELFAQFGVTEQQWRVLRVIWKSDEITAAEVSKQTLLPSPSLVGILDRLEGKDLVERVRSTTDRRRTFIRATHQGRALQAQVLPLVEQIQAHLETTISRAEMDALKTTLNKINQSMAKTTLSQVLKAAKEPQE